MSKFKQLLIIVLSAFALLIISTLFLFKEEDSQWKPDYQLAENMDKQPLEMNEKTIHLNNQELTVEIADDPKEQSQGLSYRQSLSTNKGMLFVFPQPAMPSFWMKNMNFSLDIIWINEDNIIVEITKNISPDTFPKTFSPPSPIKYVLEVNSGWSNRNNIKINDKINLN